MDNSDIAAIIARFTLIFVYVYMAFFFKKSYKKQKEAGFVNKFFMGYLLFFLSLVVYQIGISIYQLGTVLEIPFFSGWQLPFPMEVGFDPSSVVFFMGNMMRPLFVVGIIGAEALIAAQIYPLETALGWKRTPGTIFMFITCGLLFIMLIPLLTWTYYSFVVLLLSYAGVLYGFFMNIGVNLKMARATTGEVRRRSLMIIVASMCFYIGFLWTLEVGWTEGIINIFIPGASISLKWDVLVGSILQAFSAILYRSGLNTEAR
jgi:hypothetical protein